MSKAQGPLSGGAQTPGKGLTNTNTRNSSGVQNQTPNGKTARGGHGKAISGGAQLPGKGMTNTQTRNSSGVAKQC